MSDKRFSEKDRPTKGRDLNSGREGIVMFAGRRGNKRKIKSKQSVEKDCKLSHNRIG